MITKEKIKRGLKEGLVRLETSPNGDGVVCRIGDNWFYFGGLTAEISTPEEYSASVPAEDIADEIYATLKEFLYENETEYLHYDCYLEENLQKAERPRGRYLLIVTDGSSLDDYTFYDRLDAAQEAMRYSFNECCAELGVVPVASDNENYHIGEADAYVCGADKNYVFSIIKLTED